MNIIFLYGLPGSGKTTFAKSLPEKYHVIDVDKLRNSPLIKDGFSLKDVIIAAIDEEFKAYDPLADELFEIVLDGLFTTHRSVTDIIEELDKKKKNLQYTIVSWNEDRDTCLLNDKNRGRNLDSTISIKNLPLEKPDLNRLYKTSKNIFLIEREVISKDFVKFCTDLGFTESMFIMSKREYMPLNWKPSTFLTSEKWCGGGSYGNCWSEYKSTVDAAQPNEFTELEDLLSKITPELTLSQFLKIKRECCKIEEDYNEDYYGGSGVTYYFHTCDLKKLYRIMKEIHEV